jgi:iron complex outermembrane receptor protein
MKKSLILIAFSLFTLAGAYAQKISGTVSDETGKAFAGATVSLVKATDSSSVKFAVTKADGLYEFSPVAAGDYRIKTTHVGHVTSFSDVLNVAAADITVTPISMQKKTGDMAAITVTASRPIVEVKADKTILNVEGTINAVGNDGLELLRKAPGVMIDKDDNISLAGKTGVQIFIDGKPSPLSGSDLSNFLKTLQAAQIDNIEIITNPSAKYEAAGNAGIINIRLKKNKSFGTNGTLNLGYNRGVNNRYNGGINLNNRNKYTNVFGSYNYFDGKNQMKMNGDKSQLDTLFSQRNTMVFANKTHGFKAGVDYFINSKSTLGAVVTGNIMDGSFNTSGPMNFIYEPTGDTVKVLRASNTNMMDRSNVNSNLNYRYVGKAGKELNLDADYGIYTIRSNQYQPNFYYDGDGNLTSTVIYDMVQPTDIDLYSFKADYEQPYKKGKLGVGTKLSYVSTDNNFNRYNVFSSGKVLDTLKSNQFAYRENINALYVNYNRQFKGFMIQGGVRMENTHSKGISTGYQLDNNEYEPYDSGFNRSYTDFFPSAAITFNKNPMKQWTVTYSRRIDRPAYQDLNPFEFKLNEYAFMKGNTLLRPQYTNSFGLTNIYKYKLTTTLNYSHVKDIFAQVPDTTEKTKSIMTRKNLATQDIVSLSISYPFQKKWYSFFATVNSNYANYKADFGGGDRKVNQDVFSLTYYMQNTFKLGKGWTGELTGLYISPSVWQGLIRSKTMGSVDAGLQKTVFKKKGTLRLSVADIFQTMKWGGTTNFTGVRSEFSGNGEMPQFKANFSYRFGNSQVKAARQRKAATEEENRRTQQQGGMGGQ